MRVYTRMNIIVCEDSMDDILEKTGKARSRFSLGKFQVCNVKLLRYYTERR